MQKINWIPKTKLEKAGVIASKILIQNGFQSFWVGGFVRNMLLKLPSDNIDIATDAKPEEVEAIFKYNNFKTVPIGKEFGSILVIINAQKIEITTFRGEQKYSDKRHPDQVYFINSYLQDAKRRDFTINALYFDPITKFVYDPTQGMKDLKGKLIRFIGDARDRIDEDSLRMMRAVRLSIQTGFRIEDRSYAAIKHRVKHIQNVSGERVRAELDKILVSTNPGGGVRLLEQIGLLKYISPELDKTKNIFHKSKTYHLEGDVLAHLILVMGALKLKTLNLKYASLFHDVGKVSTGKKVFKDGQSVFSFKGHVDISGEIFKRFAYRYKFSKNDREEILWLIAHHEHEKLFLSLNKLDQVTYASHKYFSLLLDIWQADIAGNIITARNKEYQKARFKAYLLGSKLLKRIEVSEKLVSKLARGNVIMRYIKIVPGIKLGNQVLLVRNKIILGEIKNISQLKKCLTST